MLTSDKMGVGLLVRLKNVNFTPTPSSSPLGPTQEMEYNAELTRNSDWASSGFRIPGYGLLHVQSVSTNAHWPRRFRPHFL